MPEHGVSLTSGGGYDCDRHILLMCECGWHVFAPGVVTFDFVAGLVGEHRGSAE